MPPYANGHLTSQREHAGSRQSVDECALEGSAIQKLLETLSVLDVVFPVPIIRMQAISTRVDARTMSLSVFLVAFIH